MNKTIIAAFSLTAALLLTACGAKAATPAASTSTAETSTTAAEVRSEPYETSFEPAVPSDEVTVKTIPTYAGVYAPSGAQELDLYYEKVQVSSPTAQAELQKWVDEELNQPATQETESLRENYLQEDSDSYFEQKVLETRADAEVVSLLVRTTTWGEGAAHSNYGYRGLTASPQTGKTLTLSDLGVDRDRAQEILIELIDGYNQQENGSPFDSDDESIDGLLNNFYLGRYYVVFPVSPYQLGQPFSAGAFRFLVPYDELGVAEEYQPEHEIKAACIQDQYGARYYADGSKDEGAGELLEKFNEEHSLVLQYEMAGIIRRD